MNTTAETETETKEQREARQHAEYEARRALELAEKRTALSAADALIAQIVNALAQLNDPRLPGIVLNKPTRREDEDSYEFRNFGQAGTARGFSADGEIHIDLAVRDGRIHVSPGHWPSYREQLSPDLRGEPQFKHYSFSPYECLPYDDKRRSGLSISISAAKTPAQIAKDLVRRFLPDYLAALSICLTKREQHIAREAKRTDLAAQIAAASGFSAEACAGGHHTVGTYGKQQWQVYSDSAYLDKRSFDAAEAVVVARFFRLLDAGKLAELSAALETVSL